MRRALIAAAILAVMAVPTLAVTYVGIKATVPAEPTGINDLHIDFKSVGSIAAVSHVPTPPAPEGDVSWPVVSFSGDVGDFSGVTVTPGKTSSYKFTFTLGGIVFGADWKTKHIDSAYWTQNGQNVADAKADLSLCVYE